jgi:hypothetical protein
MVDRVAAQRLRSQCNCWRVPPAALTLTWIILVVVSAGAIAQEPRTLDCYPASGTGCGGDLGYRIDWDRIKRYQQNLVACIVGLGHCDPHDLVSIGGIAQGHTNPDGYSAGETQAAELGMARDEIKDLKGQLSEMSAAREQASSEATSRDQALKREQDKTDALTRELREARKELDSAKAERSRIPDAERKPGEIATAKDQAPEGEPAIAAVRSKTTARPRWRTDPPRTKRGSALKIEKKAKGAKIASRAQRAPAPVTDLMEVLPGGAAAKLQSNVTSSVAKRSKKKIPGQKEMLPIAGTRKPAKQAGPQRKGG